MTRKDSAFVQDEWRPVDHITVNIGARIDHVKAGSDTTRLSPRLSVVWLPEGDTTVHAGYARYFIPAPIGETIEKPGNLAATSARTPTLTGMPIRAEFDDYYDVGIQKNFGAFTTGIDTYWRMARHLMDNGQFGTAYQTINFNYAQGRVRGIELNATYNANRLSGWANVAVGDARANGGIESNQYYFSASQLAFAASHTVHTSSEQTVTASGGISYRFNLVRLSADFLYGSGLRRTLADGALNGDQLPGYVQVNVSAVHRVTQLGSYPLDARIDLINAFDRKYQLRDGTALRDGQTQWGARRGVFLGIEQAF